MPTVVYSSLRVEGFHNWPDAPDQVAFLRNTHRHMFHIRAYKQVDHADRDVEFILLGREVREGLDVMYGTPCGFGTMSCEMIAHSLIEALELDACEVSEDGENGAIVTREGFNALLPSA